MESSQAASAAVSDIQSESVMPLSPSSQYGNVTSELQPDEAGTSNKKERKCSYKQTTSSFQKSTALTPSKDDPDINALFQPRIEVDGQPIFKCMTCAKEFSRPYSARRHALIHLKGQHVFCRFCSMLLSGPLSLAAHLEQQHDGQEQPMTIDSPNFTNDPSSAQSIRTSVSSEADIRSIGEASTESVIIIEQEEMRKSGHDGSSSSGSANRKRCEKDGSQVVRKEKNGAVLLNPVEREKTDASKAELANERRSTRIKKREEIEANDLEEEMIHPRKTTISPIYPTNVEKLKELRAMSRREHLIGKSGPKQKRQPDRSAEVAGPSKKATSKRSSGEGSSTRVSSSNLVPSPRGAPLPSSPMFRSLLDDYSTFFPPIPRAKSLYNAPPLSPFKYDLTISELEAARKSTTPHYMTGSCNNHYPRLLAVYGDRVHQPQPTWPIPRDLPNKWSALMYTIFHPAWANDNQMGMDELNSNLNGKGGAQLMLPMRMNLQTTMLGKCMRALEETSFPLPPLQPLLPSPCPLVEDGCSDPLTDVLDSLPLLPSGPTSFSSVYTMTQPIYTTACTEKRALRSWKTEDRTWWEARTFPSFYGLVTPLNDMQSALIHAPGMIYSMAEERDHELREGKHTYVTSKNPIFAVHTQSMPKHRHYVYRTPVPTYTTSSATNPCVASTMANGCVTPSIANVCVAAPMTNVCVATPIANGCVTPSIGSARSFSQPQMRLSSAARGPPVTPQNQPLLKLSAPPKKRKRSVAKIPGTVVASPVKRLKCSSPESFPRKSTKKPKLHQQPPQKPTLHEAQSSQPVIHELRELQPRPSVLHELLDMQPGPSVLHGLQDWQPGPSVLHELQPAKVGYTNASQSGSYYSDQERSVRTEKIAVEQDGNTFTIL